MSDRGDGGVRPTAVLAHWPEYPVFSDADLDRMAELVELPDRTPFGTWDDPRAEELLPHVEVIVGHWGCPRIDAALLARAPKLGFVAYAAGTVKGTVADEVFTPAIRVTSGAPANAEPVAEFTLAAILFALKDVLWSRDALRERTVRDHRQPSAVPLGNWGKTVGIVGASLVGRRVLELLAAFPHIHVVLYDPFVTADAAMALGTEKVELDDLCARSDVLSIHAPDLPSTRGMIGATQIASMRTGATLINTARGALVDHEALVAELESGRLYAILDVTDPEPVPRDSPLRTLPNVFLTPHIAGSAGTELGRMAEHVIDEIRRWTVGEPAANEVTRDALSRLA